MCAVSGTFDYFSMNVPVNTWTPDTWTQFQDIIKRLDALDKKLDQPECTDPAKAAWMREVEERLAKLEV